MDYTKLKAVGQAKLVFPKTEVLEQPHLFSIDFTWLGAGGLFSFGPYEIKTIKIADRDGTITETNLLEI
jgi:hypothetical protein